ncbi:hypothetical protein E3P99_03115 [Wallemia hederae]|uniref:Anaphase-promoting complex subunit 4 WD40 domain-containing protein n=1 Tax=Wallemia hederae TaxID=1540922 RepID=A0A4T0FIZ2_9BASI|nr:hypothetical protein E3P99_03115 [Wallemia hederae]
MDFVYNWLGWENKREQQREQQQQQQPPQDTPESSHIQTPSQISSVASESSTPDPHLLSSSPEPLDDSPVMQSPSPAASHPLSQSTGSQRKNLIGKLFKNKNKCNPLPSPIPSVRRLSIDSNMHQSIRIHSHRQPAKEFNKVTLSQTLYPPLANLSALPTSLAQQAKIHKSSRPTSPTHSVPTDNNPQRSASYDDEDAVYDIKFSHDGKYLASANFNGLVRIHTLSNDGTSFDDIDVKEFRDHQSGVCSLDWSKNNFLITASLDKTVKLWHPNRKGCLATFRHNDIVTSTKFHPNDDRYFISSSLDATVKLWSIPHKSALFSHRLNELITACAFSKTGKYILVGTLHGQLDIFTYSHKGLEQDASIKLYNYSNQTHNRGADNHTSRRINSSKKIVGIDVVPDDTGDYVLVTNADNRAYMVNIDTKKVTAKFKGNRNRSMQMAITPSSDGSWISSGSEDKHIYIWPTHSAMSRKADDNSFSIPGYDLWQTPELIKCTAILRQDQEAMVVGGSDSGTIYVYRGVVNGNHRVPELKHPKPNKMSLPLPPAQGKKKSRHKRPLSALPILGGSGSSFGQKHSHIHSHSPLSLTPNSTISPKHDRHQYF